MRQESVYLDALAYTALVGTTAVAVSAYVAPFAQLAGLLFPVAALATAALLLWRKPGMYISFMWWIWFLTPEVRRLVDYSAGYNDQSLVMLTPFLVTGVSLFAVLSSLHKLLYSRRVPLALVALGLLYAYGVGILNNGVVAATFDLLNWGTPVIGGAYLLTHPQHAEHFRQATRQTFMWGLLVMGVYSIVQYFYLPPWDAYWMIQADLGSIGFPEPQQVRVFSTLNSPGPFASVLMAGLLLAFGRGNIVRGLGAAAGLIGFALSAVRAAWGGWLLGFLVLTSRLTPKLQIRLFGTLTLLAIVAVPLFTVGPVAELLSQRLTSVTDLENDTSFNERFALYANFSSFTANNPLGQGLGSTGVASGVGSQETSLENLDSGIIAVLYTFGILGTLYFVVGALIIFGSAIMTGGRTQDIDSATYIGVIAGTLGQLFFGNVWTGVAGMVLWFFPCLVLTSRQPQHIPQTMNKILRMEGPVRVYKS